VPYVTHTFPQGAHDVNKSSDTKVSPNISAAFARVASTRRPNIDAHRVERVTTARLAATAHRVDVDAIVGVDILPSRTAETRYRRRRVGSPTRPHERVVHRRAPAPRRARSRR
jgi:hypothetical protein